MSDKEQGEAGEDKKIKVMTLEMAIEEFIDRDGVGVLRGLNKEEHARFRSAFDLFDDDSNGTIEKDEMKEVFKTLGMKVTEEIFDKMMSDIDENKDGKIDYLEFVIMMQQQDKKKREKESEIKFAYGLFQQNDSSEVLGAEDLHMVMNTLNENITMKEAETMIRQASGGKNGVTLEELQNYLLS